MTAKEFILGKINELVSQFPEIRVRYENHFVSNSHFIEIVPFNFYCKSNDFHAWEEDVTFEFIGLFPAQNLSFISENAEVGLGKIDYELSGANYGIPLFISDIKQPAVSISFAQLSEFAGNAQLQVLTQSNIIFPALEGISSIDFNTAVFYQRGSQQILGMPTTVAHTVIESTQEDFCEIELLMAA